MISVDITSELYQRLNSAVLKAVYRADRKRVGANISGGVDSSTVICLAGRTIPTFTGYYDGAEFDEREYAYQVRGMPHTDIKITPQDFVENFDGMLKAAKPPYQGMGTFGQYMVAKGIKEFQDVDVVLSGEGGDELFGGYARLLRVAKHPLPDGYEDYEQPKGYPKTLKAALKYDWERLPDLLAVDEQMLGAFGLEAVAPFMDPEVVDYVLSLPDELRVNKQLLKDTVYRIVPGTILARTDKRGFPIPLVAWAQEDPVRSFVKERIGRTPDPTQPWDRGWWLELCEKSA